jgi:prepilin-type N-terminal cleavage/methylation domain-containing protein
MQQKLQQRKNDGFTIIEVMIVLAIAGLIMLIVFLAVPALQRNARNTSIKNDAGNVAGGISTYESDNDGKLPVFVNGTGSVTVGVSAADPAKETAKVNGGTSVTTTGTVPTAAIPAGTIQVVTGKTCSVATGGSGQASARAAAVYYSVETSGASALKCVDN